MERCDIIIPIYNAFDCLKECVESIIKNTDLKKNGLVLIDDKSPDTRIKDYLTDIIRKYSDLQIEILYNEKNIGFVGTVNRGMKYSKNDVILLNSDTEVPLGWVERLKRCAYFEKNVATATALSNNATLASVPKGLQPNDLPNNMSFEEYADLIDKNSMRLYPQIPTAHGFCMYIKREVLDVVGYFDEEAFGKGYGEENDFSYRCFDYGYKHLLCDDVIVFHKESQSFNESKDELIQNNLKTLKRRYPAYVSKTDMWLKRFPLKNICKNVNYLINQHNRENILFLVHDWTNINENVGGTTLHCYDLIQALRKDYNIHVLAPVNGHYKVYSYFLKEEDELEFDGVYNTASITNLYSKEYYQLIEKIVEGLDIDIIHIHHMIGHYFDIVEVAKAKGIKTIYTMHDFYSLCPSINMLYNMEKYCLILKEKNCAECLKNKIGISNDIIDVWKDRWNVFLSDIDIILTPSVSTKEIIESELKGIECKAIEHGINIEKKSSNLEIKETINIAFVGVMAKHKGADIVEYLIKNAKDNSIIFHLFGDSEYESLKKNTGNFTYHGKYKREDLPMLLSDNNIHLVCNLSIWPETYSYTLTETIACGIPVLSFDVGAVAERIKKYGFGWTIPLNTNNKELIDFIVNIKSDEYAAVIDKLNDYKIKTVDEMIAQYIPLYSVDKKNCNSKLKELIVRQTNEESGYSADLDEILNSRRWKLVSRIQLPESVKKIVRKVIK